MRRYTVSTSCRLIALSAHPWLLVRLCAVQELPTCSLSSQRGASRVFRPRACLSSDTKQNSRILQAAEAATKRKAHQNQHVATRREQVRILKRGHRRQTDTEIAGAACRPGSALTCSCSSAAPQVISPLRTATIGSWWQPGQDLLNACASGCNPLDTGYFVDGAITFIVLNSFHT